MKFVRSKTVTPLLMQSLLGIWNAEYPAVLKHYFNTLEDYLQKLKDLEHTFVIDNLGNLVGWHFDFERNGERQFAILISSSQQNTGIGSKLLDIAKRRYHTLYGWVVDSNDYLKSNGEVYKSPISFYLKNEFALTGKRWGSEKIRATKIIWNRP